MDPKRRQIVQGAGVWLAAATFPGWLAACQRRDAGPSGTGSGATDSLPLRAALDAARANGRALLVLHVSDPYLNDDLGRLFGAFLQYAPDEELAPLAAVDLACATTREIRELTVDHPDRYGLRVLLVTPDGEFVPVVVACPPEIDWDSRGNQGFERAHEDAVRARNTWLARQLAVAVGADEATLARRAADERAALGTPPAAARPDPEFARRWPCEALLRAEREPERRADWQDALAGVVRDRWIAEGPPGSTWAVAGGCGVDYERPAPRGEQVAYACGMGHVPEVSRRFLHFYTAEERGS